MCRVFVGTLDGKRPYEGSKLKWENNIEMSPQEIGWDGVDWIDLARDRDKMREYTFVFHKVWKIL